MSKNVEQEQTRFLEENQARLFYFISHHCFQLNQLLKCSICFDVYERPTTVFHCFHVFCEDCIKTYLDFSITKEPPCPICQKPIPRNDLRPNNVLAQVAEFVNFARRRIDKVLDCNDSKPPSFETILTKIKEKKTTEISLQTEGVKPINIPPPDYSLILKARKILIKPNNQIISTVEELPREVPSVSFRDGSLKTPTSNKRPNAVIQRPANKNKDLFDAVKESPVANPFFRRSKLEGTRTYTVQNRPKNENPNNTFADKIISFKDDSNKTKIIQWLSDSRNKFDTRPVTQQQNFPDSQIQFDMPSVSQKHKHKGNPVNVPAISQINRQKLEQIKIRQKSELVTHLSRINSSASIKRHQNDHRRTRSLENYVKTVKLNQKLKRHSISGTDKITIEQFNSEDEVIVNKNPQETTAIVNLIEEECLKNIEAEALQQTMQSKTKNPTKQTKKQKGRLNSPKRSKRISSKSSKLLQAIEETNKRLNKDSSGWARMKEIKKTIRKVEIKPNKLMVSGVSRCSSTVTSIEAVGSNKTRLEAIKTGKKKIGEPVVLLERMNFNDVKSGNNAYDLDVLESYFSKQLANAEILPNEFGNSKNETTPEKSCSVRKSSSTTEVHSGTMTNKSPNKLLVSAIIHNTDQDKSKDNSVNFRVPKYNSKQLEAAKDEASSSTNKVEKEKSKLLRDELQASLDRITTVVDGLSTSSTLKMKLKGEESKNNLKQVEKENGAPISSTNKTRKEKTKLMKGELQTSLDQITTVADNSLTTATLKWKLKGKEGQKNLKQVEKDTLPSISTNTVKPKSIKDESKASLDQIAKTAGNLSTSTPKSRKKLFDDDKPGTVINATTKEKNKTLISRNSNHQMDKLSPSPSKNNFDEPKSKRDADIAIEEKSKLEMEKFAEEVVEIISKTSKNTTTRVDSNLNSNSTLFKTCSDKVMDDYDDDIFMLPTQVILGKHKEKQGNIVADDDEIFSIATQVIDMDTKETQNKSLESILKHKIQSLQDTLNTHNFISKMKILLQDIEQTICKEESQTEPKICKSINDAQVQTDFTENSFFSHDATTQTVSQAEKIKHAAIQTDSCDSPRGFRISSTDLFHTRPTINTEMQTDVMACPKCNFVLDNRPKTTLLNSPTAISSTALLRDSNIIKSLSEKYVLSGSFDHIDFETQDVIKGRDIRGSSTELKSSKVAQSGQNKENASQNKIDEKGSAMVKNLNDSRLPQRSKLTCNKTPNKKSYKRIRKQSSDSDSDDGLPKNVKKSKFIQDDLSLHFASEEITQPNVKNTEERDEFLLSGGSEGINYAEYLENVLKKCDEEELMSKKSKPQQKKTTMEPPSKRSKTQDMIEECKLVLQEACSGVIILENTENFSNARQDIPKPSKLTLKALEEEFRHDFSDDVIEMNEVCNNRKNKELETKAEARNKLSESLFSTADHFSKGIIPIPSQSSARLETHEVCKNGMTSGTEKEETNKNSDRLATQSSLDELVDVLEEFDGPFEDNIVTDAKTNQNKNETVGNETIAETRQIKILQNIVIAKNDGTAGLIENTIPKPQKKAAIVTNDNGNESDDMFFSDSDVVETTPQKSKPVSLEKISLLSQAYYNPEEKIILPPVVHEAPDIISSLDPPPFSCLGEVFIPPPEFQDTPKNETLGDNKKVNSNQVNSDRVENINQSSEVQVEINRNIPPSSSLTPDLLLPQTHQLDCNIMKTQEPFITSTPYTENSQILPAKSLNLSPISMRGSRKVINPILAAQNSKFSPLTVVKCKTPPPQRYPLLATSTPKQKSILNYINTSENATTSCTKNEFGAQSSLTPIKKPCVACTRMSKEQLLAITSLCNRKLISYSNTFSAAVTHMIVDTHADYRVKDHTMKYVSAVAAGIWVLRFCWVDKCLVLDRLVHEEPYEAKDMSGVNGPCKSREMRTTSPLLRGYKIHAAPPFKSTTQKEVENVIKLLGGEVVPRPDDLMPSNGKICLIITEAIESEDFGMYEMWLETLKVVTVDLEWLSRSVGQFERLSLRSFVLCSEDSICDLGYPAELLTDTYSHSTM